MQAGQSAVPVKPDGSKKPDPTPSASAIMGEMAQVSINSRIPEFWKDHPRVWFIRLEAVLASQKLSDATRYDIVVAKLEKYVITQVSDLLVKPPETEKFAAQKERLLEIYEESEERQIKKLISDIELGDQKPSQLLRRMKDLPGQKIPDDTLRIFWQGHLPASVRGILAVTESKDLNILASVVDKIMESHGSENCASEVRASTSSCSTDVILGEIAKLNLKIQNMERSRNRQPGNNAPLLESSN
ncbi:uncharacterized protein LOC132903130 [Amyelois transitella]|uniref:uncharacterized protein LOC132903130 n=1 Tax=Amyelois transitella TaxID=680683 RepID=UPI00298F7E10|nr:uncharacterized protein LOC132903130 [Amyelois transitella]